MKTKPTRTRRPSCGLFVLRSSTRDVATRTGRKTVIVHGVELEECVHCGERLYDLAALQRIREARRTSGRSRVA